MNASVVHIEPAVDAATAVHDPHLRSVRSLYAARYEPVVVEAWFAGRAPRGYSDPIRSGALFVARTDGRIAGFGETARGTVLAVYARHGFAVEGPGRCDGVAPTCRSFRMVLQASPRYRVSSGRSITRPSTSSTRYADAPRTEQTDSTSSAPRKCSAAPSSAA